MLGKGVERACPDVEKIVRLVVPFYLRKERTDRMALKYYLRALSHDMENREAMQRILAHAYYEASWQNTDPERCGITLGNKPISSFNDYINAALKIPMMLLYKNNRFIEITKRLTFGEFMEQGYEGYQGDLNDLKLHLNMLYPHVRFNNNTLEIRLFD